MSGNGFSFRNMPWINNIQEVVDSAVNEVVHAAEDLTNSFRDPNSRGPFQGGSQGSQAQRQQQQAPILPNQQPSPESSLRAPPASARVIRQLPTICVAPEDLVDESNRECCICLEANSLGDRVIRLPCAHIFHQECIVDWLRNHHCTCPVCRYELPTDNPSYEQGRLERMKMRKPRYAMYELDRMSIQQLLALNRTRRTARAVEKKDLIRFLIDHEQIDLIPAPKPVEYDLETLKAMRISELKRAMEEAGVFFRVQDVVEKSDMVEIFRNSGRLNLLVAEPEVVDSDMKDSDYEDSKASSNVVENHTAPEPLVETVDEDSDNEGGDVGPSEDSTLPAAQDMFGHREDTELDNRATFLEPASHQHTPAEESAVGRGSVADPLNTTHPSSEGYGGHELEPSKTIGPRDTPPMEMGVGLSEPPESTSHAAHRFSDQRSHHQTAPLQDNLTTTSREAEYQTTTVTSNDDGVPRLAGQSPAIEEATPAPFSTFSILALQEVARESNVDLSSCFERREMVELLLKAGVTEERPQDLLRSAFAGWSVSHLRALASDSLVGIDLSTCSNQEEMLDRILHVANTERPHLRRFLRVLSPLAQMSLSELRGTAREWNVDIRDCIEKEEIIQRLISKVRDFGVC